MEGPSSGPARRKHGRCEEAEAVERPGKKKRPAGSQAKEKGAKMGKAHHKTRERRSIERFICEESHQYDETTDTDVDTDISSSER